MSVTARRPDASMDLLRQISETSLEPEYRTSPKASRPWATGVAMLGIFLLLTLAALQQSRTAPAAAQEREQLVAEVKAAQAKRADQQAHITALTDEVSRLQQAAIAPSAQQRVEGAELVSGARAVVGPGLVIVCDDAPNADTSSDGRIVDQDLAQLVNGLWQAGAEAISVNGIRLTATTAIRGAGSAITVDYTSLTRPYRVEAIGDPAKLPAAFAASSGGQWWAFLRSNYQISFTVTTSQSLQLKAGVAVRPMKASTPR